MKIDHIETTTLRLQYDNGFVYAGGTCTNRVTTIVQVYTDTGLVGIGSAYSHPGLTHLIVDHQLAPQLRGSDPTDVERLWQQMYRATRWYGRKGAAMSALGALDVAFWDLRGKAAGKPVWSMLEGDGRACPAYASALLWKEVDELADEAASLIERGFRRVKMRLGRDVGYDVNAVRAVRKAIGESCDLMVDGSMRYDLSAAKRLAEQLSANRVFWFEEPFEPEDVDNYVALRGAVSVPLAAGENEFGVQGFRELIRAGAVDIVQPDASRCGGISEVKKVADMAAAYGLQVATHSWSDAVAIVANAHVVSAARNGLTVEVDQTGNPFVEQLLAEPFTIDAGTISLGDAPGLGIELNKALLDEYRLEDPLNVPPGNYSDMVFEE